MESKNVYLSNKELKSLRTKCPIIGRGTEGTLFYVGQGLVYKVYHDFENQINLQFPKIYDSEGVNISKISIKNHLQITPERYPLFYNEENVRLFKEEALENAILRQKNIKLTTLPLGILYVDKRLKGCLKYHSLSTNIFNTRLFNQKTRLQILKKILLKIEELIDNNIYHVDICQKPTFESKNTNILFRWNFNPEIVDLEGKSTIYTENFSNIFKQRVELGLGILFFELLAKKSIEEEFLEAEEVIMSEILIQNGFTDEIISDFYQKKLTLERLTYYTDKLQRRIK